MTSSSSQSLWYVYGIVPFDGTMAPNLSGLDDAPVRLEPSDDGRFAALVSILEGPDYTPEAIEARSGDVDWLSPRAIAHDRVLTWASDHGVVVPMPMFSLFSGSPAVRDMLRDRETHLEATVRRIGEAREYALRIYRVDAELLTAIVPLSPRLTELASTARSAPPGQRYLLERKLEAEKRTELRAVTQQIVDQVVHELCEHAREVQRSPIPRVQDAEASRGTMVLNAAFLVPTSEFAVFQQRLSEIVSRHQPEGFRFDFTGPWPAYHFVNERPDAH
jgi:hypothetical protein